LLDIVEITRPRWKDSAEAANVHIKFESRISTHAVILGDESERREVLINIIFNAVDAMPQGGTITLAAEEEEGDAVVISIGDTGMGMSPEVKARIFDPFFTTKGKAGLGLGLAVSYGIISRHGGNIEVESQYGRGTEFRITLPLARLAEKVVKAIEVAAPPLPTPDQNVCLPLSERQ